MATFGHPFFCEATMAALLHFRCGRCGGINRVRPDKLGAGPSCGRCQARLDTHNAPHALDDDALERLIRASKVPVLVDFWAPWCGPCRMMAPHLDALARRSAGRLIVAKVNTDQHQRIAASLNVRSIPTLAVYSGGSLQIAQPGARTGPALQQFVSAYI